MSLREDIKGWDNLRATPLWSRGLQIVVLVGVLVGIASFGAWRLLLAPLLIRLMFAIGEMSKKIYWSGFDPFIMKAMEQARFRGVLAWNALTIFLDWTITILELVIGLFFLEWLASGLDLPVSLRLFAFWCCSFPLNLFIAKRVSPATDPQIVVQGVIPFLFACASLVVSVNPFWIIPVAALTPILFVPIRLHAQTPGYRQTYNQIQDETRRGIVHDLNLRRSWFPRPGVIFEPQYNPYSHISNEFFEELRPSLTVLRVNICGFLLSLLALTAGIIGTACLGHRLLIFLVPIFAIFGLAYDTMVADIDRKLDREIAPIRGIFSTIAMLGIAAPTIYFGGYAPEPLLALGLLFVASWYFFIGFLVRGTSTSLTDTLELLLALAALGCVLLARIYGCCWYESLLPTLFFGFLLPHIRMRFPRTDLPEAQQEPPPQPPLVKTETEENRSRRLRKRDRQLEALRRSQWRRD